MYSRTPVILLQIILFSQNTHFHFTRHAIKHLPKVRTNVQKGNVLFCAVQLWTLMTTLMIVKKLRERLNNISVKPQTM